MPVQLTGRADNDNAPTPARETCPRREAWAWLFAALLAIAVPLTSVASLPGEDDGLTAAKAISREVRRGGGWVISSEMEIERKFLVAELPDLKDSKAVEIEQGYLALADGEGGAEVRLRRKQADLLLTVKAGSGRMRAEEEIELDRERFESLWPLTAGRRLAKTRNLIPKGELQIELDRYREDLDGLLIAEVEFPDEETADAFEPPEWFDEEVTGNKTYLNETLATKGLPR